MVFGDFPIAINSTCVEADFPEAPDSWEVSDTFVLWDVDEYSSKLSNMDPDSIYDDIKSALDQKGYCVHRLEINAYTDENFTLSEEFIEKIHRSICFGAEGNKFQRSLLMAIDILIWARKHKSLVVLSKNIGEEALFSRAHQLLINLDFNVVLRPLENLLGKRLSGFGEPSSQWQQDGAGRG